MRPVTKKFLLIMVRHLKGILAGFEEWVEQS